MFQRFYLSAMAALFAGLLASPAMAKLPGQMPQFSQQYQQFGARHSTVLKSLQQQRQKLHIQRPLQQRGLQSVQQRRLQPVLVRPNYRSGFKHFGCADFANHAVAARSTTVYVGNRKMIIDTTAPRPRSNNLSHENMAGSSGSGGFNTPGHVVATGN